MADSGKKRMAQTVSDFGGLLRRFFVRLFGMRRIINAINASPFVTADSVLAIANYFAWQYQLGFIYQNGLAVSRYHNSLLYKKSSKKTDSTAVLSPTGKSGGENTPKSGRNKYKNLSKSELIARIHMLEKNRKTKYGLVWEDKPEDVVEQCQRELPVLEEVTSKAICSDPDKPVNLLIEGDNYHALSVLNYTHKGKIDVIYIDPPYNTGAKDWKYNNNYVDKNDGYRHSKWLSMMANRLRLAKKLLRNDGILICAVDEHEHAHISVMLEGMFANHEQHSITVVHNPRGVQGKNFSYTHEYAVFVIPKDIKTIGDRVISKEKIKWRGLRDNGGGSHRTNAKNCFYPIIVKNGKVVDFGPVVPNDVHPRKEENKKGSIYIYPIDSNGVERKWRYARQSVEDVKHLLRVVENNKTKEIQIGKDFGRYPTVWKNKRYDSNEYGTKLLREIIPNSGFGYPKSLYTVHDCLFAVVGNRPNAIILDFFAGSGTTGQAVMEINNAQGGNRKFILCTNNENNNGNSEGGIARAVCYPRIKNVIQGYAFSGKEKTELYSKKIKAYSDLKELDLKEVESIRNKNKDTYDKIHVTLDDCVLKVEGEKNIKNQKDGLGGNLKYFKTSFVPAARTDENKFLLTDKAGDMLCIREGTYEPVKITKRYRIYRNKKKHTGIVYRIEAIENFKKLITCIDGKFIVYVFSLGDETYEEEFADMGDKVTQKPIPEAILRVYRRIFYRKG